MATHISTRRTQFQYFDQLLKRPRWKRHTILDFGGNVGGFLRGAGNKVDHNRYWCLDVTRSAIEIGRRHFPRAHFEHYDRYSSYFNPNGVRHLPVPELGVKFDVVLAFSVFTHTHQKEMFELIGQLRRMLLPRGIVAFTFCDPCDESSPADPKRSARWYVEINGQPHVEPGDHLCQQERWCQQEESYCSYFTADYMASLFPGSTVHPPVSPERQHCCILRSSEKLCPAGTEATGSETAPWI
jgi:cyclopropane fatty-acyl-phospholipid synthase-like methyltransferase